VGTVGVPIWIIDEFDAAEAVIAGLGDCNVRAVAADDFQNVEDSRLSAAGGAGRKVLRRAIVFFEDWLG
jgi:hypothetical protein